MTHSQYELLTSNTMDVFLFLQLVESRKRDLTPKPTFSFSILSNVSIKTKEIIIIWTILVRKMTFSHMYHRPWNTTDIWYLLVRLRIPFRKSKNSQAPSSILLSKFQLYPLLLHVSRPHYLKRTGFSGISWEILRALTSSGMLPPNSSSADWRYCKLTWKPLPPEPSALRPGPILVSALLSSFLAEHENGGSKLLKLLSGLNSWDWLFIQSE